MPLPDATPPSASAPNGSSMDRRSFLRSTAAFAGLSALAASLAPLRELG